MGKDKVGGDGSASDGWWIVGGGAKDLTDPVAGRRPLREVRAASCSRAKGIDSKSSGSLGSGCVFAWPLVQALQIAGELDGGLTRTNFILALRIDGHDPPLPVRAASSST